MGTVLSAMVQKLPLTWWLFCPWWHVSGTVGYSLELWVVLVLSIYSITVLRKLACSQKCVCMQDVLCSWFCGLDKGALFWCRLTVHLYVCQGTHLYAPALETAASTVFLIWIQACLEDGTDVLPRNQWRTQEFCSGGGGSTNSVEDRENRDLGR